MNPLNLTPTLFVLRVHLRHLSSISVEEKLSFFRKHNLLGKDLSRVGIRKKTPSVEAREGYILAGIGSFHAIIDRNR